MNTTNPELSLRARKKTELRESIKAATLNLIAHRGTEDTTIEAICEAAGVSRKTFYNYFSSKDEVLFGICVARLVDLIEGATLAALEHSDNLSSRLDYVMIRMRDHLRDSDKLELEIARYSIISIGQRLSGGGTLLSLMNRSFMELFRSSRSELMPGLSPKFCAEMTVGMVNTVILNHLHQPDYDVVKAYDQLRDFLCRSMIAEA